MQVSMTEIELQYASNSKQYELVVSGLNIAEIHRLVQDNYNRWLNDHTSQYQIYICYVVAYNAIAQHLGISYEDAISRYTTISPADTSMKIISAIIENLGLNKRTLTVANNAIARSFGCSITTFSETVTWRRYIMSLRGNTDNEQLFIRKQMVDKAFTNNPDRAIPDLIFRVYD